MRPEHCCSGKRGRPREPVGSRAEAAVFKHLFTRYYAQSVRFSYWRGKKDQEVDLVAEVGGQIIPFEVKYRGQHTRLRDLKGLLELCQQKAIDCSYVVTQLLDELGTVADLPDPTTRIFRIPAPLLCYWMGEAETAPEQWNARRRRTARRIGGAIKKAGVAPEEFPIAVSNVEKDDGFVSP